MKTLFAIAAAIAALHAVSHLAGFADHAPAIVGMPIDGRSWVLGPLAVASYLAFVTLAPIFTIAGLLELARRRLR